MFCRNCGTELDDGTAFCPRCGSCQATNAPSTENNTHYDTQSNQNSQGYEQHGANMPPVDDTPIYSVHPIVSTFSSGMFLALCTLLLIATVFSFNLISLLLTIFCFLIYSTAKKGFVNVDNMRNVSGTLYAGKILAWVGFGFLIFFSIIIFITRNSITEFITSPEFRSELAEQLKILPADEAAEIQAIFNSGNWSSLILTAGIMLLLYSLLLGVYAYAMGILHKFAKALYRNEYSMELERKAFPWLIYIAVFNAINVFSSFSDIRTLIGSLSMLAAIIIGCILIRRGSLRGR